jgi:hypothetical protein
MNGAVFVNFEAHVGTAAPGCPGRDGLCRGCAFAGK